MRRQFADCPSGLPLSSANALRANGREKGREKGTSLISALVSLAASTCPSYFTNISDVPFSFPQETNAVEHAAHGCYVQAVLEGASGGLLLTSAVQPCFVAGTPILTPDGAKPIEQIKVGDLVLSAPEDDPSAPVAARRVEEVFERSSVVFDLQVGGRLIRTTPEHPFYVQGKGWTAAKSLAPGDLLRSHDGKWVPVESARSAREVAPVYNMRIEEYHTYFVGSAKWGFSVWVHNACRLTDLEENVGHTPYGPSLSNQDAVNAGQSLENLEAGNISEAKGIATEISGGLEPIHDSNQSHFHPVWPDGSKMPNHVFY